MPVRIAGVQPGYLPWLRCLDQMLRVDAFIVADEMPFSSSGWARRHRVKSPTGLHWLTLPAQPQRGQRICDVPLLAGNPWARKHLTALRHFYAKAPPAAEVVDQLAAVLDPGARLLTAASLPTIRFLREQLDIETPLLLSSELQLERRYGERFPERPGPTHRIIAYMEALGATELLQGESGQAYLDVELMKSFGMKVQFHRYAHPTYAQLHGPFVSHLSAIDLLLNVGADEGRRVLRAGRLRDD